MRVNIYIREDDIELWEALDNKSEFVSNALRDKGGYEKETPKKNTEAENKAQIGLCKNGHILNDYTNRCTQKDCKYS